MAISAGIIAAATTVGSLVAGNQSKQKAKGQIGQVETDAKAAQDAADASLKQQHDATITDESTAAAITRKKLSQGVTQPSTILTSGQGAPAAPVQRKTLLGS